MRGWLESVVVVVFGAAYILGFILLWLLPLVPVGLLVWWLLRHW